MTLVDKYDEELKEDITKLEQAIAEGEQLAGNRMRSYETDEDVIRKVIQEGRRKGAPIHWEYGSSKHMLDLMEWLESMHPVYQSFPFRISMSRFNPLDCEVVFEKSRHSINEKALTLKESEVLLRFMLEAIHINDWGSETAHIPTWYPTSELMSFTANLITKYNPDDLLKSFKKDDETSTTEWWKALKQQIVKECDIPRLEYIIEQMHLPEVDVESVVANKDIEGLIKALDYSVFQVRDSVVQALVEMGKPAVQPLILALSDPKSNVRQAAAETLGRIKDPVSIEPLVQLLKDDDQGIRMAAGNALAKIGKPAVPVLVMALTDSRNDVKKTAIETLGRIKDADSIEPLVQLLEDSDSNVRSAAEHSLREFRELAVPSLLQALNSENGTLRKGAASVIGHTKDSRATAPLCRMLRSRHKEERESAAEALKRIKDPLAVDPLIEVLKDRDYRVRWESIRALGEIGDARAITALIGQLKSDNKYERQFAGEAIINILGKTITKEIAEPIIQRLVTMLGDDYLWSHASWILSAVDYPITDSLIRVLHSSKDRRVRKRIPQILAFKAQRESEHRNEILSVLCQELQDKNKEVKISAAFALEKLQDPSAVEALTRALDDTDVRFAAEIALKKIQQNGR